MAFEASPSSLLIQHPHFDKQIFHAHADLFHFSQNEVLMTKLI